MTGTVRTYGPRLSSGVNSELTCITAAVLP